MLHQLIILLKLNNPFFLNLLCIPTGLWSCISFHRSKYLMQEGHYGCSLHARTLPKP